MFDPVFENIFWLWETGGVVMIPLGLCSVLMVTVTLLKVTQWVWLDHRPRRVERALRQWREGDTESALKELASQRGALSRVAYFAMNHIPPNETVHATLQQMVVDELNRLRTGLRTLELIASISPLLGLLGTVQGMILAFQQLAQAGSQVDPAVLAGGIWIALLTTAVGLMIAIPAVVLHGLFEGHIEQVGQRMVRTVNAIFAAHLTCPLSPEMP